MESSVTAQGGIDNPSTPCVFSTSSICRVMFRAVSGWLSILVDSNAAFQAFELAFPHGPGAFQYLLDELLVLVS